MPDSRQQDMQIKFQKLASRSFWTDAVTGVLLGLALRFAIGYGMGSPQTVVIPLSRGIRT